jgi:two-component system, chemotaxis family, chemotaxis protein CheY
MGANMRILVVDDSSTMRSIIRNILKQIHLRNVDEANDGNIAWEKLQKVIYDLIICDLYMPKMSGIDLLRLVRNTELTKDIPFIMITTVNAQENILEAIKENVSGYILKPFSAKTLHEKIVAIFRHGHLMK